MEMCKKRPFGYASGLNDFFNSQSLVSRLFNNRL